jgi:GNAT superfamily N-acetyltransferase
VIRIRPMTAADLPLGLRLSREAGWNQTPADWSRLLGLGPAGCFVAELDGAAVGTTTTCVFGPIAWVAMVLVDRDVRGRGIGTALVAHAIDHLDELGVRSIRLDATPLGEPLYRRLGFVAEYPLTRFQGTPAHAEAEIVFLPPLPLGEGRGEGHPESGLRLLVAGTLRVPSATPHRSVGVGGRHAERARYEEEGTGRDASDPLPGGEGEENGAMGQLLALDRSATGTDRSRFLSRLAAELPDEVCIVAPEGAIDGYLMARPGAIATQVGPCIARSSAGAVLLADALARYRGRPVIVDVPAGNEAARGIVAAAGLVPRRELLRMVRGDRVEDHPAMIWASSGPELG